MSRQKFWRGTKLIPLLAALVLGTTPATGQASTATSTIAVSATVLAFCTITASALPFGNYSTVLVNATTTISVTCTTGSTYNVGLDPGLGSGATVTVRKMTFNTSNTLNYALYSDTGRTTIWGNTIGTNTVAGTGNGSAQSLTVYGSIPAGQFVAPGSYTDTVTATITY